MREAPEAPPLVAEADAVLSAQRLRSGAAKWGFLMGISWLGAFMVDSRVICLGTHLVRFIGIGVLTNTFIYIYMLFLFFFG